MSWLKEGKERWKTSFLKETVENADLHKVVLKKTMTTQEKCVKYDFAAPLITQIILEIKLTHYFSSLWSGPGMPYHTHLKWPTIFVASIDF